MFTGLAIHILIWFINCPRRHVGHEAHHEWRPCPNANTVPAFWRSDWNPNFQNWRGPHTSGKPSIEMFTGAAIRKLFLIVKVEVTIAQTNPRRTCHLIISWAQQAGWGSHKSTAVAGECFQPFSAPRQFLKHKCCTDLQSHKHTRWRDNLHSTQLTYAD